MRKMRTPEIDVIRFTESDVIVASAKTITVAGLGDPNNVKATFQIGSRTAWTSQQVYANEDAFVAEMDAYAGGDTLGWLWDGNDGYSVWGLAMSDVEKSDSNNESNYNGTFEWNGNAFRKKS